MQSQGQFYLSHVQSIQEMWPKFQEFSISSTSTHCLHRWRYISLNKVIVLLNTILICIMCKFNLCVNFLKWTGCKIHFSVHWQQGCVISHVSYRIMSYLIVLYLALMTASAAFIHICIQNRPIRLWNDRLRDSDGVWYEPCYITILSNYKWVTSDCCNQIVMCH